MQKLIVCGLTATIVAGAFARDVYINASKNSAATFMLPKTEYWTETEGSTTAVTDPPTNKADFIHFPVGNATIRYLYAETGNSLATLPGQNLALDGIEANNLVTYISGGWTYEYYQTTRKDHELKIANPDGFEGRWLAGQVNAASGDLAPYFGYPWTIELTDATATHVPALSHVWSTSALTVKVPDAGTAATVQSLSGGRLVKDGAGQLSIGRTDGARAQIKVASGTLVLNGPAETGVVAGAALHLDASAAGCFMTYEGTDGRTYVTNWAGVAGTDVSAKRLEKYTYADTRITFAQDPFVSPVRSPSGLPLLDFGSCCYDNRPTGGSTYLPYDETLGPSNCIMALTKRIAGVREVFVACQPSYQKAQNLFNAVLGDTDYSSELLPYRPAILSSSVSDVVKRGDIRVNDNNYNYTDKPWDVYTSNPGAFRVTSVGATDAFGKFNLICSDHLLAARTGGLRIGEILLYTNELTSAQRTQVNRYLKAKWIGDGAYDAGPLYVADGAAISVPDGQVVRVPSVSAGGGKLVKKGGGTLVVESVSPADASFEVQGGAVRLPTPKAYATNVPADGATVWLDASAAGTVVQEGSSVVEWKDRRGEGHGVSAVIPTDQTKWTDHSEYPTLVENAVGTKPVVDFGTYAWMKLADMNSAAGGENAQTCFIVLKIKSGAQTSSNKNQAIFGGTGNDFVRSGLKPAFVHSGNVSSRGLAAVWTRDGNPMDVLSDETPEYDRFYVYGFSAMTKVFCNLLCKDRLIGEHGRGFEQIAEFIVYDRKLTVDEQRQTEAYLMEKWLGTPHPATTSAKVSKLSFADDTPVVLDFDDDVTLDEVTGGNGCLVKDGSGAVTLSLTGLNALTSVVVTAGSLVEKSPAFMSEAVFHFDAAARDTLKTFETKETDGTKLTWVSVWNDVRDNGVFAQLATNSIDAANAPTNPTLQSVAMPDGVLRPTVDFGPYCKNESQRQAPWRSAALDMSEKFRNIREVHSIYADTDEDVTRRQQAIFGDWSGASFYRSLNNDAGLLDERYCAATIDYTAIDGVAVGKTAALPEGFHLVSMAATADVGTDAMAIFYKRVGGSRISEEIAFSRKLTDAERTYLQKSLMVKWFGDAECAHYKLDVLAVADGASITFADGVGVAVTKLVGSGTIQALNLSVQGEIFADWTADGCGAITVAGAVSGAPTVNVAFNGAKPVAGDYVLLTADDLSAVDVSALTLVTDLPEAKRQFVSLVKVGNSLVLRISKSGLLLILR